jgi:DNA-binding HxlR family transcriptional regulator
MALSFAVSGVPDVRKVAISWKEGTVKWYWYPMDTVEVPSGRWDVLNVNCPTREVLTRVGDRWTMLVVTALAAEPFLRFSELRRRVGGVTQKMLTQTLRALERDGLVTRTVIATVPVTVEYRLTPLGHSLADTVHVLRQWAYANVEQLQASRETYDVAFAERASAAEAG